VARQARALNPALAVLYVSGDSAHDWRRHGVAGSRLVHKPFATDEILAALDGLIQPAPV